MTGAGAGASGSSGAAASGGASAGTVTAEKKKRKKKPNVVWRDPRAALTQLGSGDDMKEVRDKLNQGDVEGKESL